MSESNASTSPSSQPVSSSPIKEQLDKPGFWTHLSSSAKQIMSHVETTLHDWFSMNGIQQFPDILQQEDEVYLLGKQYSSKPEDVIAMKLDFASRPHFTYRQGFPPIGTKKFTSDSGWGCMIRVGQCLMLEGLLRLKFGRDHCGFPTDIMYKEYIELFLDSPSSPFSIHSIAEKGSQLDTAVGDWFGPTIMAQALKKISLDHSLFPRIVVAQDATVFCEDLEEAFEQSNSEDVILLIPLRLGISNIHPSYHSFLKTYFTCSTAIGIAGGRPSSALFFVGYFKNSLLLLDPHITQPCLTTNFDTIHSHQILCLPFTSLDPSLCIGFAFKSKAEWQTWKSWIKQKRETVNIPFSIQAAQWKDEENLDFSSESDGE